MNNYISKLQGYERGEATTKAITSAHLESAGVPKNHPAIHDRHYLFSSILREMGVNTHQLPYDNPEFWEKGLGAQIRKNVAKKVQEVTTFPSWLQNLGKR